MDSEPKSEYTLFGLDIKNISVIYGAFLMIWAATISIISESQSITSWIPAMFGLPILALGIMSNFYPARQKLFMHVVVVLGLICFLGGLDFTRSLTSDLGPFRNTYADISKLMLLITSTTFCLLCIKSFRFARLQRGSNSEKL